MQCRKVKFATEKDVLFHIEKKLKTSKNKDNTKVATPYFCPHCNIWHITSQTSKEVEKNKVLKEQIKNLQQQLIERDETIKKLNSKTSKEDKREIKRDSRIQQLNLAIRKQKDIIQTLRDDNKELIGKMARLEQPIVINMTEEYTQNTDGINHINVYSKGKTELGRWLSNFARTPINTKKAQFVSVESWWYFMKMEKINASCLLPMFDEEKLRDIKRRPGKEAKDYFRFLYKNDTAEHNPTKEELKKIYKLKLEQHPKIEKLLLKNSLPLTHYYVMFDKKVSADEYLWTVELWEEIKTELEGSNLDLQA